MMLRVIYTILLYLIQPFIWGKLFWRSRVNPGYRKRILERYGFCENKVIPNGILIHSVSVGETMAAIPLIRKLQERYPQLPITITTMTVTGSDLVKKTFHDEVSHVYLPYDLPGSISRFLSTLKPKLVIIMETELWPNLIVALNRKKIPLIIANARLSERSAKGYRKLGQALSTLLNQITLIAIQNNMDRDRFIQLGLSEDKAIVTGSIKFDITLNDEQKNKINELKQAWQLARPVWIAASTHQGEESIILEAHRALLENYPSLLLIIVPRHPERFSVVEALLNDKQMNYLKRSSNQTPTEHTSVFLVDTMGELMLFYGLSDIAFIGGSLIERGGHNPLEAALHHLPIMMGKHAFNFEQICQLLANHDGLSWVKDREQIMNFIELCLNNPQEAERLGNNAYQILNANQGALNRLFELLTPYLSEFETKLPQ